MELEAVRRSTHHFRYCDLRSGTAPRLTCLFRSEGPFDLIIHCAAQPSHDLAAQRPFDDFDVNAVGTINLLEITRQHSLDAVSVFMSTNKVYGDAPNELPLKELDERWEYARAEDYDGITEQMRIDGSKHSIFGASKVAADVMTQEYGRYFGMKTHCLRGGCLTGPQHSAVELHGYLGYIILSAVTGKEYVIYGYKGKQVRDNIHSYDLVNAFWHVFEKPRAGAVYNMGGSRHANISMLEAIAMCEQLSGRKMNYEYVDENRNGDHICYITNLARFQVTIRDGKSVSRWTISLEDC